MGVRTLSDLSGVIEVPKYGSGLSAAWVNENEAIPTSDMTFDKVSLSPRHVGAISSWSRQLAQTSNPSIEALLRDDLAFVIGAAVDKAIIAGDGVKADNYSRGGAIARSELSFARRRKSARAPAAVGMRQEPFAIVNANDLTLFDADSLLSTERAALQRRDALMAANPALRGALNVVPAFEMSA